MGEVECKSLSKLSQERPSPWKLSPATQSRMLRPKSRTKKESRPISSVSFSRANNWRMVALFPTTTSRRSRRSISSSDFEAASRCHLRAAVNEYPPSAADSPPRIEQNYLQGLYELHS